MSVILWSTLMFLVGILVFIATPLFLGPKLPRKVREGIANKYFHMAMYAMGRALIVARKGGGYGLYKSVYDSKQMEEKIDFHGEPRWFNDHAGCMHPFQKKPLGLVDERFEMVWDPIYAEIGECRADQHRDGTIEWTDSDGTTHLTPHTKIPGSNGLVNVRKASHLLGASFAPSTPDMVDSFIEKALAKYKSRDMVKDAFLIIGFLVGFGAVLFAAYMGLTSGDVEAPGGNIVGQFEMTLWWWSML